jgi:hypothetical protein
MGSTPASSFVLALGDDRCLRGASDRTGASMMMFCASALLLVVVLRSKMTDAQAQLKTHSP